MDCLPPNLSERSYYQPGGEGLEKEIGDRLKERKRQLAARKRRR